MSTRELLSRDEIRAFTRTSNAGGAWALVTTWAVIVGAFERQLDEVVLLALFLPAVVYLADAVGTQTETVLIRGFTAGVKVRDVMV